MRVYLYFAGEKWKDLPAGSIFFGEFGLQKDEHCARGNTGRLAHALLIFALMGSMEIASIPEAFYPAVPRFGATGRRRRRRSSRTYNVLVLSYFSNALPRDELCSR